MCALTFGFLLWTFVAFSIKRLNAYGNLKLQDETLEYYSPSPPVKVLRLKKVEYLVRVL